jgi:anti-sigma-K factor RskA
MMNDAQGGGSLPDNMPDHLALDALLRRADRARLAQRLPDLEARIVAQAAFPLAARRRDARGSTAEMLAGWVRVAIPLAAAAALFAALSLSSGDTSATLADVDLSESDPAALLSALESDGSSGLAHHLIANDVDGATSEQGAR